MRSRASLALAASLVLAPGTALAGASARLVYVRGPGAEACPSESAVRAAVGTRLGYDPFFAWAHDTLFAEIVRTDGTYHATIKLAGDDNQLRGGRELSVKSDDCSAVIDAMALSISLTIDPSSILGRPAPARSADVAPLPPAPSPAPPSPSETRSPPAPVIATAPVSPGRDDRVPAETGIDRRLHAHVGLGVLGSLGADPSATAGATVFIGASWRAVSLDLEARGDLPTTAASDVSPSHVQAYLLAGSIVPCLHYALAFGCPVLSVGRLDATSVGPTAPREATDAWVGAGGRAGLELALSPEWMLRAYGELLGTVRRDILLIGGASAYTFAPASGDLGVAVAWRFR